MKIFILVMLVIITGCTSGPSQVSMETSISQTQGALSAATALPPTDATQPTATNLSTETNTPTATATTEPTSTHTPTITSTPTITPVPTESILYFEDFEDGRADNMFVYRGHWSIVEEQGNSYWVGKGPNNYPQTWYSRDASTWMDYAFESRIKIVKGSVFISVRANKGRSFYNAQLNGADDWVVFADYDGKNYETFGGTSYPIHNNQWHTVRLEVQGSQLRLFIDNNLATSVIRTSHDKGGVGYYLGGGEEVHFDDLKVWQLFE